MTMGTLAYTRTQDHWEDLPSTATPVDGPDLENYDQAGLMSNNTRITLIWNGSTYVLPRFTPTGSYAVTPLSDTSRPREFVGPVDPSTITGVVLAPYDTWVPVS
jgi:hypothetical protein